MTLEKNLFVLCENIILDTNRKVTLVNIYDIIYAQSLPAFHGKLAFAANIKIQNPTEAEKKFKIELSIKSPSKKEMLTNPIALERNIDITKKIQNIGIAIDVNGVMLSEYGTYEVNLRINDTNISPLYFEVTKPPKAIKAD
ncbi:hypothetical protein KKF69_03240 [Patescibacteria group bacterium]|nr:hypothetical protein [Patescibacteria group bacterium]MBU4016468.1 hypothetical protein [Patescibacteria group bacterium]